MLKRLRTSLSALAIVSYARESQAIDPYTVVKVGVGVAANAGTGGAAGVLVGVAGGFMGGGAGGLLGGGGGGDAEDLTSIGFAFTDLLDDFEVDKSGSDELRAQARELEDFQAKIREGESEAGNAKNAVSELGRAEGIKQTLEAVHNMVQRTKSIAQMIPGHPKATQSALSVQQTRLNYMLLDEVSKLRQLEIEKRIDKQTTESKYQLIAKIIREEEKSKTRYQ